MKIEEFEQLGQLLKLWADEQAICEYRCFSQCTHPDNRYSSKCGLRQCPNPKPLENGKNIFLTKGYYHYFWIQEK